MTIGDVNNEAFDEDDGGVVDMRVCGCGWMMVVIVDVK